MRLSLTARVILTVGKRRETLRTERGEWFVLEVFEQGNDQSKATAGRI